MTAGANPLQDAFPPELGAYARTLGPPRADAVPLMELLQPRSMGALVDTYATALAATDRRAVLSLWSQHYFLTLLPPVIAGALVGHEQPAIALETAGVVLSAEARAVSVCVPDHGPPCAACPVARLTPLLRTHLDPLATGLAAAGLHPAVVWSNAGHVVAWVLRTLLVPPPRCQHMLELLRRPVWVDGGPNPLHPTLTLGARTACCLRHRVPGLPRCPDCPLVRRGGRPGRIGGTGPS